MVDVEAWVYHYGWVKDPKSMQQKQLNFNKYWHDDQWIEDKIAPVSKYEYEKHVSVLKKFKESHPEVMKKRIKRINWEFDHDISIKKRSVKEIAKKTLLRFGFNVYYSNYIRVKSK